MLAVGDQCVLIWAGSYNSDAHLYLAAIVTENGYDIFSKADSNYDPSVTGSRRHVENGYFTQTAEFIFDDLIKRGVIPKELPSLSVKLNPEAMADMYQFDQKRCRR